MIHVLSTNMETFQNHHWTFWDSKKRMVFQDWKVKHIISIYLKNFLVINEDIFFNYSKIFHFYIMFLKRPDVTEIFLRKFIYMKSHITILILLQLQFIVPVS